MAARADLLKNSLDELGYVPLTGVPCERFLTNEAVERVQNRRCPFSNGDLDFDPMLMLVGRHRKVSTTVLYLVLGVGVSTQYEIEACYVPIAPSASWRLDRLAIFDRVITWVILLTILLFGGAMTAGFLGFEDFLNQFGMALSIAILAGIMGGGLMVAFRVDLQRRYNRELIPRVKGWTAGLPDSSAIELPPFGTLEEICQKL
ncbi:MAG: hypothetical protein KDA80_05230 [Planctomycetaceae bacterium]|nr:hypothetical protein [Planctomycetaceae bacterium]